jgi:Beta-propeller repeat
VKTSFTWKKFSLITYGIAFVAVLTICCHAQTPLVSWVQQSISSNNVSGMGIALDGFGNTYAVGNFNQTTTFGSVTINGAGGFLTKYDSFGNVIWATQAGGTDGSYYNKGVATDGAGNAYIVGKCGAIATFGNITITNSHSGVGFVAKSDGDGTFIWAKPLVATGNLYLYGVATDTNGNCYVTGRYDGDANFGTNLLNGAGFVAKYDSNGNFLWATPAGAGGNGVALDGTGNVFVAGGFSGSAVWGNAPLQTNLTGSAIGGNMSLAKYNGAGNLVWVSSSTNAFSFSGAGIPLAVGSNGNAYVAGLRYPLNDSFICQYSTAGNRVWLKFATNVRLSSIAVDSSNHVYVTGVNQLPDYNYFLGTYDSSGNLLGTNGYGGIGSYDFPSMAVANQGQNIYLTGAFANTVTFGGYSLTTSTDTFGFLLADLNGFGAKPPNLDLQMYSGFTPALTIHGFVGSAYQIDFADSLQQTNWHSWVRFALPSSPFTVFDPSPNPSMRFYRAELVQP